ncbi:MAG TPA: TIGR04372 family glycosyltransferase [Candidatus Nanoarchaeia archaeon]|nr:TIGR04372 family glycosyltransferase [Candidatus Nanoarchaeia archaeon]
MGLIDIYNRSKILKTLTFALINLTMLPVVLLLFTLDPLVKLKFIKIRSERIGHLAANTEVFLRRLDMGIIKKRKIKFIGITGTKIANKQLLKMYKRVLPIIQVPEIINGTIIQLLFNKMSLVAKLGFFKDLPMESNEYKEFSYGKPVLKFTGPEKIKGEGLLREMGLKGNDWFICFHSRGPKYLAHELKSIDTSYHDYRNWDIATAMKAVEYINSKGGYAVRMGAIVEKRLPDMGSSRVIDYATKHRSEFGDIYLPSRCKFFLGDGCGLNQVGQIFNVPEAWVNVLPLENPPWSCRGVYIPKKLYSLRKKRLLTFKEIVDSGLSNAWRADEYKNAGVRWVDNTPEEILDLVKEVNERIDGAWRETEEDREFQKRFRALFRQGSHCHGFLSRIGAKFLRENKHLLE